MFRNIFQINPYPIKAIDRVTSVVQQVLLKNKSSLQTLEIEFKYAQFVYFDPNSKNIEDYFQNADEVTKKKASTLYNQLFQASFDHQQSLNFASKQGLIVLNDLGKRIYKLKSEFNQREYKSFYHIRQFLLKLCRFNQQNKKFKDPHVFQNISKICQNKYLKLTKANQIRMDIIVKNQQQLDGRYSYQIGAEDPWTKVNKISQAREQLDLMVSEKLFRLGLNQQKQTIVSYDLLGRLHAFLEKQKNTSKNFMVRIKRAIRVVKNDTVQFSLSEVYQPQRPHQDLANISNYILSDAQQRDEFVRNNFLKFYGNTKESEIQWEIQAEFTKKGVQKLYELAKNAQFDQLKTQLHIVLEDLNALYYAQHAVKIRQVELVKLILNKFDENGKAQAEGRLDNQFGSYMRDILYQVMNSRQKKQGN